MIIEKILVDFNKKILRNSGVKKIIERSRSISYLYPDCGFKFVLNLDETAKFNLTLIQRLQYTSNLFFLPQSLIWIWNLEFQFLIKSFVSIASSLFISNYKILGTRLRIPVHHHHFGGSIMKPNMDFRSQKSERKNRR